MHVRIVGVGGGVFFPFNHDKNQGAFLKKKFIIATLLQVVIVLGVTCLESQNVVITLHSFMLLISTCVSHDLESRDWVIL